MVRRWTHQKHIWLTILIFTLTSPVLTSADPAVRCDSLRVISGTNGNYVFTATASDGNGSITGYTFDFGDKQSYTVSFGQRAKTNKLSSTVTHTYHTDGSYTPQAHVNIQDNGKRTSISSPTCQADVTVGSASNTLPDTGVGNTRSLFVFVTILNMGVYQLWLRRRVHSR